MSGNASLTLIRVNAIGIKHRQGSPTLFRWNVGAVGFGAPAKLPSTMWGGDGLVSRVP